MTVGATDAWKVGVISETVLRFARLGRVEVAEMAKYGPEGFGEFLVWSLSACVGRTCVEGGAEGGVEEEAGG